MGHALSCIAVLFKSSETAKLKALSPMGSTAKFFKFYLAARQLLDDGHDWKRDYEAGILNAVGADLVSAYVKLRATGPISTAWMEKEFAERGLERLCSKVRERAEEAKKIVDAEPAFIGKDFFYKLLEPPLQSAERAVAEAQQGKEFMLAYGQNV